MLSKCEHLQSEIRWRTLSNGARQAWRQCLSCFQVVGTAVKHADAPKDAPPFDEEARDNHWRHLSELSRQIYEDARRQREAEWQDQRAQRRQEYLDYLDTAEWRRKRAAVLERDNYICQAQMEGCTHRASQAHHLTYDHIFNEPLFDLVAVCRACHESLHSDIVVFDA